MEKPDEIKNLKKLASKMIGKELITNDEFQSGLNDIINVFAQYRSATGEINQDTKKTLNLIVKQVNEEHTRILKDVKDEIKAGRQGMDTDFTPKLKEINRLLKEINTFKTTFKDGETPIKGIDYFDGEKGEPGLPGNNGSPDTRKEIVDKINGGGKEKINASEITGLPEFTREVVREVGTIGQIERRLIAGTGVTIDRGPSTDTISASGSSITLTTTGTSGAATLVGSTLNIPIYSASIGGISRTIINTAGDFTMGSVASTDYDYYVKGAHNGTIPTTVGNTNHYYVRNNHTASVTLTTSGGELINQQFSGGAIVTSTVVTLEPGRSYTLGPDGTGWNII